MSTRKPGSHLSPKVKIPAYTKGTMTQHRNRHVHSVTLSPLAWEIVDAMAREQCTSRSAVLERLVREGEVRRRNGLEDFVVHRGPLPDDPSSEAGEVVLRGKVQR